MLERKDRNAIGGDELAAHSVTIRGAVSFIWNLRSRIQFCQITVLQRCLLPDYTGAVLRSKSDIAHGLYSNQYIYWD